MTLSSIFRSPLMIGAEMTKLDDETFKLLTNKDIIAMNKNARHSHQVWRKEINGVEMILWVAVCDEGGWYVAVFNAGEKDNEITFPLTDLEIYDPVSGRDLWSGAQISNVKELKVNLPAHGATAFLLNS